MTRADLARALAVLLTKDPVLSSQSLYGSLVYLGGEVSLTHANKKRVLPKGSSTRVDIGDNIEVGSNGQARIDFPDGSSLLLKSDTTLTIKNIKGRAYIKKTGNPGIAVDSLEIDLPKGTLFGGVSSLITNTEAVTTSFNPGSRLASLGNIFDLLAADPGTPWYKTAEKRKVKVKVDMPWGVCGIRGSFWSNNTSNKGSSMTLLEGDGEYTAAGKTMDLNPGQSSNTTSLGGEPTVPSVLSTDEQNDWAREKAWVQQTLAKMIGNQGYGLQGNPAQDLQQFLNNALSNLDDGSCDSGGGDGGGCGGC